MRALFLLLHYKWNRCCVLKINSRTIIHTIFLTDQVFTTED